MQEVATMRVILGIGLVTAALAINPIQTPDASAAVATAACVRPGEGCCPTFDPNVDCWADGHWHYNHCKNACT